MLYHFSIVLPPLPCVCRNFDSIMPLGNSQDGIYEEHLRLGPDANIPHTPHIL